MPRRDARILLSNYTCGHTSRDVPSLMPVREAPAALAPPQSTRLALITDTCISCDGTLSLENMVKLPCKHQFCKNCFPSFVEIRAQVSTTAPPKCCGIPIPFTTAPCHLPLGLFLRYLACQNLYNKPQPPLETKQGSDPPAAPTCSQSPPIDRKPQNEVPANPAPIPPAKCTHETLYEKATYNGKCRQCGYNRSGGDQKHHYIMQCNSCKFTACQRCYKERSWE